MDRATLETSSSCLYSLSIRLLMSYPSSASDPHFGFHRNSMLGPCILAFQSGFHHLFPLLWWSSDLLAWLGKLKMKSSWSELCWEKWSSKKWTGSVEMVLGKGGSGKKIRRDESIEPKEMEESERRKRKGWGWEREKDENCEHDVAMTAGFHSREQDNQLQSASVQEKTS